MTHYDVLGVPKTATPDEVKTAYRIKVKQYHPDANKHTDTKEQFLAVQKAYEILSDTIKRQAYDAQLQPLQTFPMWPFPGYTPASDGKGFQPPVRNINVVVTRNADGTISYTIHTAPQAIRHDT